MKNSDPHGVLERAEAHGCPIREESPPHGLESPGAITAVRTKASNLKVLFLDVDGVLTDGRIWLMPNGEEVKCFDVKDGLGLKLLMEAGVEVVLISARTSGALSARAKELGIRRVHQGSHQKGDVVRKVMDELGIQPDQAGAVGDDLPDLEMFGETGLCFTVADARPELKRKADFVSQSKAGRGAVREICDFILGCRNSSPHPTGKG